MTIESSFVIGEIKRGKDIGLKGSRRNLYSWLPCEYCGKLRWVSLRNGQPEHKHCMVCKLSPFNTDEAILLYRTGKSLDEVGKILKCSSSAVERRLKPLGILRGKADVLKGKKLSQETRLMMSISKKEQCNDLDYKVNHLIGGNNPFYGHKHKLETIEAMKKKLSIMFMGEKSPCWRGGKSFEPYTSEFKRIIRIQVYIRDNYQCQNCGVQYKPNSSKLVAHHKDADKKNNKLDNLITLCRPCHANVTQMWYSRISKEVAKTQ